MAGDVVISIASHVARGSVGNRAMAFALERLGFETWSVPTIVLAHHPGHGPVERIVPDAGQFASLLEALIDGGRATEVTGIISGYLASPEQAHAVATLVEAVKAARPEALYLCDPVIGDRSSGGGGGLYVAEPLAAAIRDELLPLADLATPNAFECAWLANAGDAEPDLVALARAPSAAGDPRHLGAGDDARTHRQPPRHRARRAPLRASTACNVRQGHRRSPRGTPSRAAAQGTEPPEGGGDGALSSMFEIVAGTAKAGADELMLAALQDSLVTPHASVVARRLGPGTTR